MLTFPNTATILLYEDADAECARRILAALMTNTPKEHEQARSKATDGYAMAADVLEGSEV